MAKEIEVEGYLSVVCSLMFWYCIMALTMVIKAYVCH